MTIIIEELRDSFGIGGGGGTFGWGSADVSMGISGVSSIGSGVSSMVLLFHGAPGVSTH